MIGEYAARFAHARGLKLLSQDRHNDASRWFHAALALRPASVGAWVNLGNAFMGQADPASALGCFKRAIRLSPTSPAPKMNAGMALITLGDWLEGWKLYEARFDEACVEFRGLNGLKGADPATMWDGSHLAGQSVLVFNEQGAGDVIMCLRYYWHLKALGAREVIWRVPGPLVRLVRATFRNRSDVTVISDGERLPDYDRFVPFMSLPYHCSDGGHGSQSAYLKVYPNEERHAVSKLPGPRIGLVRRGSPGHKGDRRRSVHLAQWGPLLETPGVSWVSLQIGASADEFEAFGDVVRYPIHDFYDTACIMRELDLVISVDSSPAHLAGALGVPVWTLLPFAPDFRWGLTNERTPLYESMHLFRQTTPGDWASVIDRVRLALRARLNQRSAA